MSQSIKLRGINDFLGSREERYFSYGYKGVSFLYKKMEFSENAFGCRLNLSWNLPFGKKQGKSLTVHLGTVEYFNISCAAADLLLSSKYRMSDADRNRSWIAGFDIKTSACNKDSFIDIPVSAEIIKEQVCESEVEMQTKIKVMVGQMIMYLFINHPIMNSNTDSRDSITSAFRKQVEESFYTKGYKESDLDITDLNIDLENSKIDSILELSYRSQDGSWLGRDYYPGFSISDFVLSTGQLTQVLLYLHEGLFRSQTNNLWLREMNVRCEKPSSGVIGKEEVSFTDFKRIKHNGDDWSMVSLNASLNSITASIKVAHMLPKHEYAN